MVPRFCLYLYVIFSVQFSLLFLSILRWAIQMFIFVAIKRLHFILYLIDHHYHRLLQIPLMNGTTYLKTMKNIKNIRTASNNRNTFKMHFATVNKAKVLKYADKAISQTAAYKCFPEQGHLSLLLAPERRPGEREAIHFQLDGSLTLRDISIIFQHV